jgi:hypothetical protein
MEGVRHSKHEVVSATYRAQLDKSAFFRFVAPLIFSSSIPRDGISRTAVFPRTHSELARMMGYKCRESYTRNGCRAPRLVARQIGKLVKGSVYRFLFAEGDER